MRRGTKGKPKNTTRTLSSVSIFPANQNVKVPFQWQRIALVSRSSVTHARERWLVLVIIVGLAAALASSQRRILALVRWNSGSATFAAPLFVALVSMCVRAPISSSAELGASNNAGK